MCTPFASDTIQCKTEISTVSDFTIKPSTFFPQSKYIYVFCMFVGTNSDSYTAFLIAYAYNRYVVYCRVQTELLKTAEINQYLKYQRNFQTQIYRPIT